MEQITGTNVQVVLSLKEGTYDLFTFNTNITSLILARSENFWLLVYNLINLMKFKSLKLEVLAEFFQL